MLNDVNLLIGSVDFKLYKAIRGI